VQGVFGGQKTPCGRPWPGGRRGRPRARDLAAPSRKSSTTSASPSRGTKPNVLSQVLPAATATVNRNGSLSGAGPSDSHCRWPELSRESHFLTSNTFAAAERARRSTVRASASAIMRRGLGHVPENISNHSSGRRNCPPPAPVATCCWIWTASSESSPLKLASVSTQMTRPSASISPVATMRPSALSSIWNGLFMSRNMPYGRVCSSPVRQLP
jgi:hypothetical protein